jgi:hypothetical protein
MSRIRALGILALAALALLAGCSADRTPNAPQPSGAPSLSSFANSEWSEPVNLGAPINSAAREMGATLGPDDLTLYVTSDRTDLPGSLGGLDIWVSRRACLDCPWGTPVNLGPVINSPHSEGSPELSNDGLLFFFSSNRAGIDDIYVSRRTDKNDDRGWGTPVMLGADVNTDAGEVTPDFLENAEEGRANLYFTRGQATGPSGFDIYYAPITRDGETLGPAVLVGELSFPGFADARTTMRTDGREVFFWSTRPGSLLADLWVSTRRSVHEPWSPPSNLGAPVNSAFPDLSPGLSKNGRTLVFVSGAGRGGLGLQDIWMTTRTPGGEERDQ